MQVAANELPLRDAQRPPGQRDGSRALGWETLWHCRDVTREKQHRRRDTKQGPGSGFVDRDHDPRTSPTSKAEPAVAPPSSVTPHSRTRVRSRFTANRRLQECGRWQKDPPRSQKRLLSKTPDVTKLLATRSQ